MTPIGIDTQGCIKALHVYVDEIDELLNLLGLMPGSINQEKVRKSKQLLQNLKDSLRQDYHQRRTGRGESQMSHVEKTHFFPAVHEALTRIYVRTNSTPSQRWIDELADAQSSILFYLSQLEDENQ